MAVTFVSHRSATVLSVAMIVRSSQLMLTCAMYRHMKYELGIVVSRMWTPCTSLL